MIFEVQEKMEIARRTVGAVGEGKGRCSKLPSQKSPIKLGSELRYEALHCHGVTTFRLSACHVFCFELLSNIKCITYPTSDRTSDLILNILKTKNRPCSLVKQLQLSTVIPKKCCDTTQAIVVAYALPISGIQQNVSYLKNTPCNTI